MTTEANKAKLLHLAQFFYEQTDEEHGASMKELIEYLNDCGISAERKAIYRDIEVLREFGLDIQKVQTGNRVDYRLIERRFSAAELLLLVDAVQSSRFLTKGKSDKLVRSVKCLGSKYQVINLNNRIHVPDRIKMQNESVFNNVDTIQQAMRKKRQIKFKYFKYGANKKRIYGKDGGIYEETPVHLVFSDGFYYLVVYNEKYEDFANYRVDRMEAVCISDEPASRNEAIATYNPAAIEERAFSMFAGKPAIIEMSVEPAVMSVVIDRFGKNVKAEPGEGDTTIIRAAIMESPTFYGWLAQLGTQVRILSPARVAENYRVFLQDILDATAASPASCSADSAIDAAAD